MLNLLFVSANNRFNIDMCHFVSLDIAYGSICCFATRYALRGEKLAHIHIECEQSEHISNFEHSEKYIEFAIGEHIDKKKGVLSNDRQ